MVSVTYGVGVHARGGTRGCNSAWPEKRLKPSLEAFLKAAAFKIVVTGKLQRLHRTIMKFTWNQSQEESSEGGITVTVLDVLGLDGNARNGRSSDVQFLF